MRAIVRISDQAKGDDSQLGKIHIARENALAPCCGLHISQAGHWQVDIAAEPDCKRCILIHQRFVGTFTPPFANE